MKRISYLIVAVLSLLIIGNVKAETIHSIKMNIYIDKEGSAHVEEVWDATPTEKTEYYHAEYNLGNSEIKDFKVRDESREYEYTAWDINASLNQKAYKYGINYTSEGIELCFGKSSYKRHTYTLNYTITNFVSNVDDAQITYFNLLDSISPSPGNVEIKIYADEPFSDTLDVWGYRNYGGLAYVSEGAIYLSNESLSSNEAMVVLVKFPIGTFNTTNNLDGDFNKYLDMAEVGATHYVDKKNSIIDVIMGIVVFLFNFLIYIIIGVAIAKSFKDSSNKSGKSTLDFGVKGKHLPKDVEMFRDIPCNKDIYRAYWVAKNYNLMKKQTDFLGAVLLKWLKQGHINIESKTVGTLIKKEDTTIVFKSDIPNMDNELEHKLYNYMKIASKDNILESREFEKWCSNNYSKILNWFDDILDFENEKLVKEGKLIAKEKTSLKIFKSTIYEVDPSLYDEAIKMKGLKEFFNYFSNMEDKEAIEVMLWEEYLMYAQIFGVAEKVAKQFKKLYPEVITDYNYSSVIFVHDISYSGMSRAQSARAAAQSYSSGGGGFSSGGGGGGSFGGGGGGSR